MIDLIPSLDSGVWHVYVRARDDIKDGKDLDSADDTKAGFSVIGGSDDVEPLVGPFDEESAAYLAQARNSSGCKAS